MCFVFTPDNPNVYSLNATAWLVFELCEDRAQPDIVASYRCALDPAMTLAQAAAEVGDILLDLESKGIVQRLPWAAEGGQPTAE